MKGGAWCSKRRRGGGGRRMTDDGSQPATDWRTLTLLEGQRTEARRKNYSEKTKIFRKEEEGHD